MLAAAIPLAISGTLLIVIATLGLTKKPHTQPENHSETCDAPSPDDSMTCTEHLGHYGWHRNGSASWYGIAWDCDHWADTQAAPTAQAETPSTTPAPKTAPRPKLTPRPKVPQMPKIVINAIPHPTPTPRPQIVNNYWIINNEEPAQPDRPAESEEPVQSEYKFISELPSITGNKPLQVEVGLFGCRRYK